MGTRYGGLVQSIKSEDHPHAYGDKSFSKICEPLFTGSSPRVWGQVDCRYKAVSLSGIIPTRMGTSKIVLEENYVEEDHPHAYGDKALALRAIKKGSGSSPRVWGQAISAEVLTMFIGIIPTRMGTRFSASKTFVSRWDHPHAYGDKDMLSISPIYEDGSSPRVWGQDCLKGDTCALCGIIPTRMGTRLLKLWGCGNWQDHPHAYGDKK